MKTLKKYPSYKNSGVEWLGDVPRHWEVKKLKWLFNTMGSGTTPSSSNESYYGEDIPWINTGDFNDDFINKIPKSVTEKALKAYSALKIYPVGTLLVALYGATIGKLGILTKPCTINQACFAMGKPLGIDTKFAFYWFLGNRGNIISMSYGGGQPNISGNTIKNLRLTAPPVTEQRTIADFLDRRTGQIDDLIAKKERVIELLREKRTALISHAVTKGLNPDAKMKASGIEWLGKVPEHWDVKKLKYLTAIKYGLGQPPKEMDGGLPLLRATNVERGKINTKGLVYVDPTDIPYERDPVLKTNDIIVVRSGAYTGDSAITPPEFDGAITGYDMVVRTKAANPMFVAYSLLGIAVQSQINLCRLRAAQPHLNAEELGGCLLVVPSTEKQKQIADFLDSETSKIDALIAKVTEAIEKLKEYRTALISAAVTGKIDVRGNKAEC